MPFISQRLYSYYITEYVKDGIPIISQSIILCEGMYSYYIIEYVRDTVPRLLSDILFLTNFKIEIQSLAYTSLTYSVIS